MITRIVKMTFKESEVETFLSLFADVKQHIRDFDGCESLDLLRDIDQSGVMFTYSQWRDQAALDRYRHSDLFKKTWTKTKMLFEDRAKAWSTQVVTSLPAE